MVSSSEKGQIPLPSGHQNESLKYLIGILRESQLTKKKNSRDSDPLARAVDACCRSVFSYDSIASEETSISHDQQGGK